MKIARLGLVFLFAVSFASERNQVLGPKDGLGLSPTDLGRVHEGTPAPDFTLLSVENNPITLSSFRGRKNVVLVFYRGYW
jgi:cytochrome oxidase Cu insertion factor (SCO1/SenC/PrrC family)